GHELPVAERPARPERVLRQEVTKAAARPWGLGARGRADGLRHGLEPVADAVPSLDERVGRRRAVDLLAKPADEDVHGAVAMRLAPAPQLLQQLVAGDDAAAVERELIEEAELRRRQLGAAVVD